MPLRAIFKVGRVENQTCAAFSDHGNLVLQQIQQKMGEFQQQMDHFQDQMNQFQEQFQEQLAEMGQQLQAQIQNIGDQTQQMAQQLQAHTVQIQAIRTVQSREIERTPIRLMNTRATHPNDPVVFFSISPWTRTARSCNIG
jgi:septal ring factor EnvC (AmiA/AmiB activator)